MKCFGHRLGVMESVLREIRAAIIENAQDTLWMRDGITTVVDYIDQTLGVERCADCANESCYENGNCIRTED